MMNEIYHFVIWGFKRLNIYYSLYFVGIFCITFGILNDTKIVALIGSGIMFMYMVNFVFWMPLKYYFEKFKQEKEDTFNILKGDKYSNGE